MGQDSPLYPVLVNNIIEHMDVSNREQLLAQLAEASKPDPQQQQMEQQMHQLAMAKEQATVEAVKAQANESNARANKYNVEAQLEPQKLEIDRIDAVADVRQGVSSDDFKANLEVAKVKLKARELDIKDREATAKISQINRDKEADSELDSMLG
jgi:hypothetical protein